MNQRRRWAAVAALAAGCGRTPAPEPEPAPTTPTAPAAPRVGSGRFPHSAIRPTVGPADGAATELILSAAPIESAPTGGYVSIGLDGAPARWSNRSVRVKAGELSPGWVGEWSGDGTGSRAIPAAEVRFLRVAPDDLVEGEYAVTLADGQTARGWFRAKWLPHPGQ